MDAVRRLLINISSQNQHLEDRQFFLESKMLAEGSDLVSLTKFAVTRRKQFRCILTDKSLYYILF